MSQYLVVIEQGENGYGAYSPDLPGCAVVGETVEEVERLMQEAIAFHIEGLRAKGQPVPEPSSSVRYMAV